MAPRSTPPEAEMLDVRTGLMDRFGRSHTYLRISLTDRCNFRCTYCMPAERMAWRDRSELLTRGEIVRLARIFASLGVTKVRLTGGEPTVRPDLVSIAAAIRAIPGVRSLGLTTNGYRLAELAEPLRDAGIQALNVSLDSLCRDRFARIARRDALPAVQSGLERALALGFESVKVNVVVIAGVNDDEIPAFAELARDRDITVRFIEYMPFRGNGWEAGGLYPRDRMLSDLAERYSLTPIRFSERSVADVYSVDGFRGRVGFIASMTHSFCGDCSRVRLTADGRIKSCLFSPAEADLRDAMRRGAADDEIEARIRAALLAKRWEHPPAEALRQAENRSMVEIGG